MFPQSKEGKSPLHMAAIHGRFTRSQILIQNGMDLGHFVSPFSSSHRELISRTSFPSLFCLSPGLPLRMSTWSYKLGTTGNGPLCLPLPLRLTNKMIHVECLAWHLAHTKHSNGS